MGAKNKKRKQRTPDRHSPGEHIWEGLKKYNLTPEEATDLGILEGFPGEISKLLKKLQVNEYLEPFTIQANETNTAPFLRYIDRLKNYDIDIGKGNFEYGFKMPLAEKGENYRKLIIFRRWKK